MTYKHLLTTFFGVFRKYKFTAIVLVILLPTIYGLSVAIIENSATCVLTYDNYYKLIYELLIGAVNLDSPSQIFSLIFKPIYSVFIGDVLVLYSFFYFVVSSLNVKKLCRAAHLLRIKAQLPSILLLSVLFFFFSNVFGILPFFFQNQLIVTLIFTVLSAILIVVYDYTIISVITYDLKLIDATRKAISVISTHLLKRIWYTIKYFGGIFIAIFVLATIIGLLGFPTSTNFSVFFTMIASQILPFSYVLIYNEA